MTDCADPKGCTLGRNGAAARATIRLSGSATAAPRAVCAQHAVDYEGKRPELDTFTKGEPIDAAGAVIPPKVYDPVEPPAVRVVQP